MAFQSFTDRPSRTTERMKRNREDEEDEEERTTENYHNFIHCQHPQQQQEVEDDQNRPTTPPPTALSSSSSSAHSDDVVADEEEANADPEEALFPAMPLTRSEKREWRDLLCQILQHNKGPLSVKDFIAKFGWSPAIQSGRAYRAEPSLCEYIIVVQGLVYALPTDEEWYKLSKAMRKSDKIQSIEGLDAGGNAKTFNFLSSDDYMAEYEQIYDENKGLFKVNTTFDDGEIRRQHLSCWITNRNGKWFLDEKPSSVGRRERKRAHRIIVKSEEEENHNEADQNGSSNEIPRKQSRSSGPAPPTTITPSSTVETSSQSVHGNIHSETEEELERKIRAQNLPLWLIAPIRFV